MFHFSKDEVLEILILTETDCGGDMVNALNHFFGRQCTQEEHYIFCTTIKELRRNWVEIVKSRRKLDGEAMKNSRSCIQKKTQKNKFKGEINNAKHKY